MNRKAPSARLVAIPIVAAGLLLGSSTAGAYQDETPVVPVETPAPPATEETPAPDPAIEPPVPPANVETPDPDLVVETPESGTATEPLEEPDVIAVSGAGRSGGEPSSEEDPSITAAAAPQPSTDGGETAKPLPRGRVSVRNVRRNVDVAAVPNPAPAAADPDPSALPGEAVAGAMVAQGATIAGVAPSEPVTNPPAGVPPAALAPRAAVGVPAAAPAPSTAVGASAPGPTARSGVIALPATGIGSPNERGSLPSSLAILAGALLFGARRLRRGRPA